MWKEFRDFAMRGNAVDMAVGIVIGAAFATIVKSLVDDIIMPPIGLMLGGVDFTNLFFVLKPGANPGPFLKLADAKAAGAVTINYGVFINSIVTFVIIAFAVFMVIRAINRLYPPTPAAATTKECPHCASAIPIKASRCPHCTSDLAR
jgi:large conductance mechanosensitive channel